MSLVSPADIRVQIKTSLTDEALQMIINRTEADVIRRCGPHYDPDVPVVETVEGSVRSIQFLERGVRTLFVRRPISSVISIVEDDLELTTADYRVWAEQGRIQRLPLGLTWGLVNVVTYQPEDDSELRKEVIIELVRLALERTALRSESVGGEYSYSAPEWEAERVRLMRRLRFWGV